MWLSQEKSVIMDLADRTIKLFNPEYRTTLMTTSQKVKDTLIQNNYPVKLISTNTKTYSQIL